METTEEKAVQIEIENTSGKGKYVKVPDELFGWNWGAFFLTWIWGLANESHIALLAFVPIVNLFIPFYLGAKGNDLAWRNKYWYNVKDFKTTQKKWAIAGLIVTIVSVSLISINFGIKIQSQKQSNQMADKVFEEVISNPDAMNIIGDEPQLATNLGRSSTSVGGKTISESHAIVIRSKMGMFTARANIKNEEITDIEIIVWNSNTSQPEKYTFYP